MPANESPVAVESPCVKVCTLDTRSGLCLGCGRRIVEIERWTRMNAGERARVMAELPQRLAAGSGLSDAKPRDAMTPDAKSVTG